VPRPWSLGCGPVSTQMGGRTGIPTYDELKNKGY
jgi:hypothetical protein